VFMRNADGLMTIRECRLGSASGYDPKSPAGEGATPGRCPNRCTGQLIVAVLCDQRRDHASFSFRSSNFQVPRIKVAFSGSGG
jgi:hypothetical protein